MIQRSAQPSRDREADLHEMILNRDTSVLQARLAAIVDSSDDAIVSKDLDGTVRSWNRGAQALFGYSAEEMIGQSILRLIPPELHPEEREILAKISRGERIEHYDTIRMRKNGERVEVSLSISPLRDATGRIVGASKIARDVSTRHEAEGVKAVLASIVQSADDAIISKSLTGIVTSWNPAAERLYGFKAEEMVGQPILRIIPPEMRSEEDYILGEIRAGRRIEHFETERLRKDGSRVQVSITVSPVRNAAGVVTGASKIARDVTAQREAQRRKDEFLAVLAHELRNPLAPIRTALALVREEALPAPQRERAVVIADRQMAHLTRLLDDLLDVSRLSTGRIKLKKERVDLTLIARQSAETARPIVESRLHRLELQIGEQPLWIHADGVRIAQVINNLLTNAAKYTDPGGLIQFSLEREGDFALMRVQDSGIGFLPEMKERLFTMFSQESAALDRAAGGLGIGLALVREFVERHGGSVTAFSSGRGQGALFTVRLPLLA